MNRFRRWLWRLRFFRDLHRRSYDRQAAAEFLFERRLLVRSNVGKGSARASQSNERAAVLAVGNPAPYSVTRREDLCICPCAQPDNYFRSIKLHCHHWHGWTGLESLV